MEKLMEEFGQAFLGLIAGISVIGMFVWLLNKITAF